MPATATDIRVPVRTWQEKAVLATAIGAPLYSLTDSNDHVGGGNEFLAGPEAANILIDAYRDRRAEIRSTEALLYALRDIEPGPDSVLVVPGEYGVVEALSRAIEELVETDISRLYAHAQMTSQRQIAEATVVAIDLRDGVSDLEEAMAV
jgi:hypothetical protein